MSDKCKANFWNSIEIHCVAGGLTYNDYSSMHTDTGCKSGKLSEKAYALLIQVFDQDYADYLEFRSKVNESMV